MKPFPVGGDKQSVFSFMSSNGFVMSKWSDKSWKNTDGVEAMIYGTGSMLRLVKDGNVIADAPIREAMKAITHG